MVCNSETLYVQLHKHNKIQILWKAFIL